MTIDDTEIVDRYYEYAVMDGADIVIECEDQIDAQLVQRMFGGELVARTHYVGDWRAPA
jgi:hypothetical protein